MDIRFVSPDLRRLDELKCEAVALPFFEDERPLRGALALIDWRLCGGVSRLLVRGRAKGALEETVLMPTRRRLSCDKLFLFGAGRADDLSDGRYADVVERMLTTLDRAHVRSPVLGLPGRATGRFEPARAMELLLAQLALHPEHDEVVLVEPPEASRAMEPVIERQRRRERAEDL